MHEPWSALDGLVTYMKNEGSYTVTQATLKKESFTRDHERSIKLISIKQHANRLQ
jgi:hypothetical protein